MTWSQLKNKHTTESIELKYYCNTWNWQLYILDGNDVYVTYIPRPDKFNQMVIPSADQTQAQNDYDDFNDNYKADAEETKGVYD